MGETPYGTDVPNAADRPGWIADQPVTVDVDSLRAFGHLVRAEHDTNVQPNKQAIIDKLAGQRAYTWQDYAYSHVTPTVNEVGSNPTLGVDPRPQNQNAQRLSRLHLDCERQAQLLLESLSDGLQAIADAADQFAAAYKTQDALNAMDMHAVRTYFESDAAALTQTGPDPSGGASGTSSNGLL
jgi:hypothetical protein